jgi:hypothetical protein
MAKQQVKKSVVRTANSKGPSIRDQLLALAVEYTTTEQIQRLRDEIKAHQGGKYQEVFAVAQRCTGLAQFEEVTDAVKAHMKSAGQNIDRTYSNAVSAVKRYWKLCVKHEGMKVTIDKKGTEVVLSKSIKQVKTFNALKACAEAAKKALESSGTYGSMSITSKVALLQSKLKHAHKDTAEAALDAALKYFQAADKLAQGNAAPRKGASTGAQKATA